MFAVGVAPVAAMPSYLTAPVAGVSRAGSAATGGAKSIASAAGTSAGSGRALGVGIAAAIGTGTSRGHTTALGRPPRPPATIPPGSRLGQLVDKGYRQPGGGIADQGTRTIGLADTGPRTVSV